MLSQTKSLKLDMGICYIMLISVILLTYAWSNNMKQVKKYLLSARPDLRYRREKEKVENNIKTFCVTRIRNK